MQVVADARQRCVQAQTFTSKRGKWRLSSRPAGLLCSSVSWSNEAERVLQALHSVYTPASWLSGKRTENSSVCQSIVEEFRKLQLIFGKSVF